MSTPKTSAQSAPTGSTALQPAELDLHDAEIRGIRFNPLGRELVLEVTRHGHWLPSPASDPLGGHVDLLIRFEGLYDFDFDCGGFKPSLTVLTFECELDEAISDAFPIWKWTFSLCEGELVIRATEGRVVVDDRQGNLTDS